MLHIIDIAVVIIIITILLIIFKFNYQKTLLPQVFVYSSTAHKVKESNFFQCNVQVSFLFPSSQSAFWGAAIQHQ